MASGLQRDLGVSRRLSGLIKPHRAFPVVARMDRAINAWTNRAHLGRGSDQGLRRLSRMADRSLLWAGIGLGIAATGRRGRHVAGRGYGSLLAASVVTNLIGKGLFGGDRPSIESLPFLRNHGRQPRSPSFPSGHASSAAAFAVGAGLESPILGAALAPVAGAVMYSRLHTGAHWFSDVAGGAAIGAGVALVGRALVPPAPGRETEIPSGPSMQLPAMPDGSGLFAIINPHSGSGRPFRSDPAAVLSKALPQARFHLLQDGDDIPRIYAAAIRDGVRAIGVCGGDGTVATAAAISRENDLPLVVFPGGTFNHFAKSAGLSTMDIAIEAVRRGTGIAVDVADLVTTHEGQRDSSTVLNTFAIGIYPELVAQREKREKRIGKALATIWAAGKVLRKADPVRLRADGRGREYWSLFVGVNRYYPENLAPMDRRRLDDELLDIRTAGAQTRRSRLRTFLEVSAGDRGRRLSRRTPWLRDRLLVDNRTAGELQLSFDDRENATVTLAHDGETFDLPATGSSATLSIRRRALRVYAPVRAAQL